ncbi:2-phospho-L-lactate guanylyltransferase [Ornithinimicrobium sp. Y1694]|uniref:2-phospho-L-lactate guanylyltransferase n=1 Tax=Ornithinimicrobium sp. Y1694 TaxID=3418590 RepID=UPI003CF16699
MSSEPDPSPWRLVVPVKRSDVAKTRLEPPHPLSRPELARAVAQDTLQQVCSALPPTQVTVVTSDPDAASVARELGAHVVPDPGHGLNAAVRAGLDHARSPGPSQMWPAVLLGDLPALRAADLTTALAVCARHTRAVVPDLDGTGTVLLTATGEGADLEPSFGKGSAARHASTAVMLDLDLPRLRRDVDTWADLRAAADLGVGPATRAALTATTLSS